eukprot:CAMPEP_0115042960 /NCGR_PEP_ID=MMETSP0216-20121206/46577_1 /TAXON_ID=223996 /ORGANISM="Protocruzia adherens, Strain Boccale" /LENGTH=422 /DNA_ID=CAMNT_0002425175 /DNA_START=353 /DNA_END=1621 /DNA_ORIENTATION=+
MYGDEEAKPGTEFQEVYDKGRYHDIHNLRTADVEDEMTIEVPDLTTGFVGETCNPPIFVETNRKYVWEFSDKLDKKLRCFDDSLIKAGQYFHIRQPKGWRRSIGYVMYIMLMAISASTTIEAGVSYFFISFLLGYDIMGTYLVIQILILAFWTQIPKRFIWRFRPYMVGRALKANSDKTSSFPSRAVTGGFVYSFSLLYSYNMEHETHDGSEFMSLGGMIGITLIISFLTSLARVNFGVHYPSDCVGGLISGAIIFAIGHAVNLTHPFGCPSCMHNHCYADKDHILTLDTFSTSDLDFRPPAICALLVLVFILLVSSPKIKFWNKTAHVLGSCFSCISLKLLLLCPHPDGISKNTEINAGVIILALIIVAVNVAIGFGLHSVKARRVGRYGLMIVNSVGFLALLFSYTPLLIYWRLKQQKLE